MGRLLIDYTSDVLSTKRARYHGGGNFSRFILHEITDSKKFQDIDIRILWPENFLSEYTESEKKIKEKFNISKVDRLQDFDYLNGDILFIPMIDSMRLSVLRDVKKRAPFVIIYCVLHGVRIIDLEKCDKYDTYYYSGIKSSRLALQIGRHVRAFEAKRNLRKFLNYVDRCYTVSNCSMQEINKYANVRYIKYFTRDIFIESVPLDEKEINDKYILFVSANREEKNFIRALIAFCKYKKLSNSNIKFYVVGTTETFRNKLRKVREVDKKIVDYDVRFFDYVTPSRLDVLYKNCAFLLYPSRSEGYGLPPLEAMRWGRPTVASSMTSVPEVLGMGAYYVNPLDVDQIVEGIMYMDNEKHQHMYEKRLAGLAGLIKERGKKDIEIFVEEILSAIE